LHAMTYYIFLKSLRLLEQFRKNPHIKIPPKSYCINFQSLDIFKNLIFIPKGIFFLAVGPVSPATMPACSAFRPVRLTSASSSSFAHADRTSTPHTPQCCPPPAPWRDPNGWGPLHNNAPSSIGCNHIYYRRPLPPWPPLPDAPSAPIKSDEHPRPSPPLFPSLLSSLTPSFTLAPSSSPRHSLPPSHRLSDAACAPVSTPSAPSHPPPPPSVSHSARVLRAGKAPPCPLLRAASVHHGPEPRRPVHTPWTWSTRFSVGK
jgi:hypothetical protein